MTTRHETQAPHAPESVLADRLLFARAARGDLGARSALIARHMPLARRLAWRYARSRDAHEDLAQVAYLGLVKAIDRYEADRGAPFESYAIPTIVGELKRWFRDTTWTLHVPRDLQERCVALERTEAKLTEQLGRSPSAGEVADALGVDAEAVIEAREVVAQMRAESLDRTVAADEGASTSYHETLGADDPGYRLIEDETAVMPAIASLSEREREALALRFFADLTQSEIGERLGVSQMHVSRILRRAIDRVRADVSAGA